MKRFFLTSFAILFSTVEGVSQKQSEAPTVLECGALQRTTTEVTVYNTNLALIKETRTISLPQGVSSVLYTDVASAIMPPTVSVFSASAPGDFSVLEQNYEYDLISPEKLLDKYVGKAVKLGEFNQYQDRKTIVDAILLSNNGSPVFQIDSQIYLDYPGYRILPGIPKNLRARPTLSWVVRNASPKPQTLQVSYLTTGIVWTADYVLVIDNSDSKGSLTGWVTIDNQCGAGFDSAKIKLVAGEVQRVSEPAMQQTAFSLKRSLADAAPQMREESFFEYHLYDLSRPTTLADRQSKQLSLLQAGNISIDKQYEILCTAYQRRNADAEELKTGVFLRFKNEKSSGLGLPLPAGIIRMYKKDSQGAQQFIGEERIGHTPLLADISLKAGNAFDISAKRVQTAFRAITTRKNETSWDITIKNGKKEKVVVSVLQQFSDEWNMVKSSIPHTRSNAFSAKFDVPVGAQDSTVLSFTAAVGAE